MASERKKVLLRLDPAVHDALARWAADELRSTNAQIEFLLRKALSDAGRLPAGTGAMRRRGRPSKSEADGGTAAEESAEPD
ncbi:type II toxin-antitoxin system antitoxin [Salinifilum ghardaiensis]